VAGDNVAPREAGVGGVGEARRRLAERVEPRVLVLCGQPVENVDEVNLTQLRPPLQDRLLESLDEKAIPDKAVRNRVADGADPAEALEFRPEPSVRIVEDEIAGLAGAALSVGLFEDVAVV
jgi:hypothetical protein